MKNIALIHDWFDCIAGSEKVVKEIVKCYSGMKVHSIVDHLSDCERAELGVGAVETSFIQKLPFSKSKFRNYLALMPMAIEQFDLSDFDVVLSSSHAIAKGVITSHEQLHISYVHTPIRYAWELQHEYLKQRGLERGLKSMIVKTILHNIRRWDQSTANRPDVYIANSKFIAGRIRKTYDRPAHVVYPPVDVGDMKLCPQKDNFYLAAGRLVPYKRYDLVVEAFSKIPSAKLVVIGDGPEMNKLKSIAGANVQLLGYQSDEVLRDHMQRAKGFVFAALEDFGIMPVEAQACGTPVIAFNRGGTAETVIHGKTGLHFEEQTVDCLTDKIQEMEELPNEFFDPIAIRAHAEKFDRLRFREEYSALVEKCWQEFKTGTLCDYPKNHESRQQPETTDLVVTSI